MKQDIRSHWWFKALTLLVTLACAVALTFGCLYCGLHWDSFFGSDALPNSLAYNQAMNDKYSQLMEVLNDFDSKRRGQSLGYVGEQYYQEQLAALSPENTNFRYIIRDNVTGEILLSSSGEDSLENVPPEGLYRHVRTISPGRIYYGYREYDDEKNFTVFFDDNGAVLAQVPGDESILYQDGESCQYALEYGMDALGEVQDALWEAAHTYYTQGDIRLLYATAALALITLAGTVLLMCCAGRRVGAETFTLNWTDRIPYDLYLFVVIWGAVMCFALGASLVTEGYRFHYGDPSFYAMLGAAGAALAGGFALSEAALMSTAARCKAHTLLKNTLIWRIGARCWELLVRFLAWCFSLVHGMGRAVGALPLTGRVIGFSLAYLLINFFLAMGLFESYSTGLYLLLLGLFNGYVLLFICRWTMQWHTLRRGAQAIVGGAPDTVIDTSEMKFFPDLRAHAEALNDLGSAINTAVDERLKSERMKAELITNVSHDLKTPLTSIINYVDLLKKEDIQGEKAREYIEVLDRKSQRLKKLTEDLVEASKASTGALPVNAERLGVVQLITQALGEYSEKFAAADLTPVVNLTEEEVYVTADGRHLWRIVDNLLGNCVKYAMAGTRVYLDLVRWDGQVTLSVKNISAGQLNIPAEQLMERFVRGDESRTTEGSGLGLSIARSLTELQGGTFRLEVDGDLFKAVVSFPEVK